MNKKEFNFNKRYFVLYAVKQMGLSEENAESLASTIEADKSFMGIDDKTLEEWNEFYQRIVDSKGRFKALITGKFYEVFTHLTSQKEFKNQEIGDVEFEKLGITKEEFHSFVFYLKRMVEFSINDDAVKLEDPKTLNEFVDVLESLPEVEEYLLEDNCYAI